MINRKNYFIILLIISLFFGTSCISKSEYPTLYPTNTPTTAPSILLTQLAIPIAQPTIDSIAREAYDFLPPPTPTPSATPTNIFAPVLDIDKYDGLVITLERQVCFGSCPGYTLRIFGSGKGIYEGKDSVEVMGIRNFTLSKEQLDELVKAFEVSHYFSFANYYSIPVTDTVTVITSISFQGRSKTISRYGWCLDYEKITIPEGQPRDAAPQALCDLENKIDEIVNTRQWTEK